MTTRKRSRTNGSEFGFADVGIALEQADNVANGKMLFICARSSCLLHHKLPDLLAF